MSCRFPESLVGGNPGTGSMAMDGIIEKLMRSFRANATRTWLTYVLIRRHSLTWQAMIRNSVCVSGPEDLGWRDADDVTLFWLFLLWLDELIHPRELGRTPSS